MMPDLIGDLRRFRERSDWLLTALTAVVALVIFVFAPLQAGGIFAFQAFIIGGLLAIIGGMVFISDNPMALVLMSIALVGNLVLFLLRLYYPLAIHLDIILAGTWLIVAVTLGFVVAQRTSRFGGVAYRSRPRQCSSC